MEWYTTVLRKYVEFSGRARRKEFWMFTLFNVIIQIILSIIDRIIGTDYGNGSSGVLTSIYGLAVLLPSIAVGIRRLHDTNRSGWWILIGLIPCVGWIILIVWYATEGVAGPNQYGPDPKAAERGGFAGGDPAYPPPYPPQQ
jgi:uncharacterized membrane protein YhaH (DUF805 family)